MTFKLVVSDMTKKKNHITILEDTPTVHNVCHDLLTN